MNSLKRALLGACLLTPFLSSAGLGVIAQEVSGTWQRQMDTFMEKQEASPLAPPSYTFAVASGSELLYSRVRGPAILGEDRPMSMDTRLYIASVTKSFVGLLAAKLDAEGVLPLDMSLADAWPALTLPSTLDATAISMADLLSHTSGIVNDPLVIRTAYSGATPTSDYQQILENHTVAAEPTFDYENIGYLIYAAIAEQKTGKSWQQLLDEHVHKPLGLEKTTNVASSIPEDELGLGNHLSPLDRAGWRPAPAKADDLMHPAGGHFLSTHDAVSWLQAHLNNAVMEPAVYQKAHTKFADISPAKKYADMSCNGYALGWNRCDYAGHRVFYHGGAYNGMMIFMMFLPDDDLVISSINGARAIGWTFGWNSVLQAMDFALETETATENAQRRSAGRVASHVRYLNYRVRIREAALREATTPEAATLRQALVGRYVSEEFGEAFVCETDNGALQLSIGRFAAEIAATGADSLVLFERAYGEPQKVDVERSPQLAFSWEGGRFRHTNEKGCVGSGG